MEWLVGTAATSSFKENLKMIMEKLRSLNSAPQLFIP